jgi:hypothetical protein
LDVARGEIAEAQLTAFIKRRDRQRRQTEGERRMEEAWMESERRYDEERRRENRAAWYGWHLDQAERHRRTLEDLIKHHETQAERLCESEATEGAA